MKIFKRYATVAYDGRNLSILSVESISPPQSIPPQAKELRQIYAAALTPHINATSDDTELSNGFVYQLGWVLRVYQDNFRDAPNLPLDLLRGFLTVPTQFSTVVWLYANATAPQGGVGIYPLPPDFETTASAAQVSYRALMSPWIVYTFSAVGGSLVAWGASIFGFIFMQRAVAPNTSVFPEIDISSKQAGTSMIPRRTAENGNQETVLEDYPSMLRKASLGNSDTYSVVKAIQGQRLRVAQQDSATGDFFIVIVTGRNFRGDKESFGGQTLQKLVRGRKYC